MSGSFIIDTAGNVEIEGLLFRGTGITANNANIVRVEDNVFEPDSPGVVINSDSQVFISRNDFAETTAPITLNGTIKDGSVISNNSISGMSQGILVKNIEDGGELSITGNTFVFDEGHPYPIYATPNEAVAATLTINGNYFQGEAILEDVAGPTAWIVLASDQMTDWIVNVYNNTPYLDDSAPSTKTALGWTPMTADTVPAVYVENETYALTVIDI